MYRKELVQAHEHSGSSLPIHDWVNLIGKKMSRFSTPSDIYAPIPVYVKLSGSVNEPKGTVKLFVDATNPEWYKQLTSTLQKMTSINGSNVEITNMLGKSIKDFTPAQLYAAGECDLRKSNEVVRVNSFAAPPAKMLGNKHQALTTWWRNNTDALAKRIASELKGKSQLQLENACNVDGPVQKIIENHLSNNTIDGQSWDDFMENYSNGKTNLRDLSQKILHTFRIGMSQNEQNIHDYYALSESINNNNNSGQKMFKKSSVVAHSIYTNDLVMFQDIAEDALRLPVLENAIVNGIRYGTIKNRPQQQQQSIPKPKMTTTTTTTNEKSFHPLQTYYQTYHYNRHGKLPGHIMSQYNKNAGVVYKDFPGDAENTINAFLTFSGRNILIGGKAKRRKHHWFHNKKKHQQYDDTEQQILSKLVPIEGLHCQDKIGKKAMPDLIDIGDDYDEILSKLEPIECHHNNDDEMYLEGEVDNIDKGIFLRQREYLVTKDNEAPMRIKLTNSKRREYEKKGYTVEPIQKSRFYSSRDEVSSAAAADMTIGCHHNDSDDEGMYMEGEVDNIDLNIFRKKKRYYKVQKQGFPTKKLMLTDKEKKAYEDDGFTVKLARRKGRLFAGDEAPVVPIPTDKELSEPLWKKKLPTLAELLASPSNN